MRATQDRREVTPAVNQIETHPFFQRQADQQLMRERGVQLESWGPFAEGRNNLFSDPTLSQVGAGHGKSLAQVVLRWLIQREVVVIPKSGRTGWRRTSRSSTSSSPTRRWPASPRWTPAPRCSSTTATLRWSAGSATSAEPDRPLAAAGQPEGWGTKDRDESIRTIHRALEDEINFIDTASAYSAGESEEIVGKALAGGWLSASTCR